MQLVKEGKLSDSQSKELAKQHRDGIMIPTARETAPLLPRAATFADTTLQNAKYEGHTKLPQ